MWLISVLLLGLLLFVAWNYSRNKHKYWASRGISTPPYVPFLGHAHRIFNKKYGRWVFENEVYNKYGGSKVAGFYEFHRPVLVVGDPDLMKNILVKDFDHFVDRRNQPVMTNERDSVMNHMLTSKKGDDWKALRSIISPTFTSGKMKAMFPLVCAKADALVSFCLKEATIKRHIDMKYNCGRYTIDTLASCAFGIECNSLVNEDAEFPKKVSEFFKVPTSKLFLFLFYRLFAKIFTMFKIRLNPPELDFFKEVVTYTITKRKKRNFRRGDFLDLLLDAGTSDNNTSNNEKDHGDKVPQDKNATEKTEESLQSSDVPEGGNVTQNYNAEPKEVQETEKDENGCEKTDVKGLGNILKKQSLDDNTIVAQCLLFLVAGYDTTASTLAFASFLLAKHPTEQERLRQELRQLLDETQRELTYDALIDAKFLDACVMETLRLYPPGPRLKRLCNKPYKLPGTDLTIPKGMLVHCQVWSVHHDERYWPEPEMFSPDRFMPCNRTNIKSFTHIPFGMGPRNCIGMRFALMEAKVALAKLVLAVDLKVAPGHEELILDGGNSAVLRPKNGVNLILTPLKNE